MITYLYWTAVVLLVSVALGVLGFQMEKWRAAMATAALVFFAGAGAYFFHFQQIFVKRWGGVMTIKVPEGHRHMGATWKEDNLWIENYDPATNTCQFSEYSKGSLLQGRVIVKDCNPLMPATPGP